MHQFNSVAFFEPTTLRQKLIKWAVIFVLNLVGISLFVSSVQDMCYYERVFCDSVYVEAVISASRVEDTWVGDPTYERRLSYVFNGKQYDEILHDSGRSASRLEDDGKTITVMIDKDNPAQLSKWIVSDEKVTVSVIVLSLAVSLLAYGIAIEFASFRQKRVAKQRKKYPHAERADYYTDIGIPALIICLFLFCLLLLAFPNVF